MPHGSLMLSDLQATQLNSTVAEFGLDNTFEAVGNQLTAHNRIVEEMISDLVEPTTFEMDRLGGVDTMTMEDADELTVPRAQKITAGANLGYPLLSTVIAVQWSESWFKMHTVAELAGQMDAVMTADLRRVRRDILRAFFYSANYTHVDYLSRGLSLAVKRLINADSFPIPSGPNGEVFDASSHTHYLARAGGSWASTDLDALINTIREHFETGEVRVYINQAQEAAVRAFTGFVAYVDPRVIAANSSVNSNYRTLDSIQIYNRPIGIYNGAEVWVKPWVPANYVFCWNAEAQKPLKWRWDPAYGRDLAPILDWNQHPWQAKGYRRVFGVGVYARHNGACQIMSATTWTNPTIT